MNISHKQLISGSIGIFDSGYGGLTILSEIQELLPQYDYIYLGDNARAPYGSRSFDVVYEFTKQAVFALFEKGCNLVILACNTASAKALRSIQQNDLPYKYPSKRVLGVIRPTTEIIDDLTTTKHVGILGTEGTIQSNSYPLEIKKLYPHIKTFSQACPMWVPLVENREFDKAGSDYFIEEDINKMLVQDQNIDCLILGCTHYPLLIDNIRKYTPSNIKIISQGIYVAASLKDYLARHPEMEKMCSKGNKTQYYTTESPQKFRESATFFLNKDIETIDRIYLESKSN